MSGAFVTVEESVVAVGPGFEPQFSSFRGIRNFNELFYIQVYDNNIQFIDLLTIHILAI